jgi:iron complex transport system substrate-binding protein
LACSGCDQIESPSLRQRQAVRLVAAPTKNLTRTCDTGYHAGWDYFPEKTTFEYSDQLRVEYHGSFKLVDFVSNIHKNERLRYILYQCGAPRPAGFSGAIFIEVPLQRAVLNNPAFGSTLDKLGIIDRFYGVNGFEGFTNAAILKAGKEGRLHEMGTRRQSTIENALAIDPDAVFLFYSGNPIFNLHPALAGLGVGGVALADIFESTPLGRTDWVKFMALFFNEEAQANRLVDGAAKRYLELKALAHHTPTRPIVLEGFAANRDTWTAVGGGNNIAALIEDAGARYFLDDDRQPKANLPMPFEKAVQKSFASKIWLGMNGVVRVKTKRDLVRNAPQVAELGPVRAGDVYAVDLNMNHERFFPYSDQSLDKPDVMLGDLVSILHPELLPGYRRTFIRRLD